MVTTRESELSRALGKVEGRLEGLATSFDRLVETIEGERKAQHEAVEALSTAQRTLLENYNSLQYTISRIQPHVETFAEWQAEVRGRRKLATTLHAVWVSVAAVFGGSAGALLQHWLGAR